VADSEVLHKQYKTTERWGSNDKDISCCSFYNSDVTSVRQVGIKFKFHVINSLPNVEFVFICK